MALDQHRQGISPKDIWRRAGFDINEWTVDYTRDCLKRWKKIVSKKGFKGLMVYRATGRPKTKGTDADKIKRLELQVRYLEAENHFLAKLRAKRAESNSGQVKNLKSLKH
jgi:hypothetical protein